MDSINVDYLYSKGSTASEIKVELALKTNLETGGTAREKADALFMQVEALRYSRSWANTSQRVTEIENEISLHKKAIEHN